MFYLIVWHATDGNDCTVFDTIVEAETEDKALHLLCDKILDDAPEGTECDNEFELACFFPCDCGPDAECDGHGGTYIRYIIEFDTLREAEDNKTCYHTPYYI
jgi:hypothetical protein